MAVGVRRIARRAALVLALVLSFAAVWVVRESDAASFYACTRVIGYSTTKQWFDAGPFEAILGTERWERLTVGGKGQIQNWADPAFFGWDEPVVSPCTSPVDRALIDVGALSGSSITTANVLAAANNARAKYGITDVLLQPMLGGPDHTICGTGRDAVRSTVNHAPAHAAIDGAVAADPRNAWGNDALVSSCLDFSDSIGHLTPSGALDVSTRLGSFYAAP